jgi:hypothetical protein
MHACILTDVPPKQRTNITYLLRSFQSTHNEYLRNTTQPPVHHCTGVQFAVRSGAQGIVRTDAATHGAGTIGTSSRASFKPQECIHAIMIALHHAIKHNKTPWRRFVCGAGQAPALDASSTIPTTGSYPEPAAQSATPARRGSPPAPSVRKWALSG